MRRSKFLDGTLKTYWAPGQPPDSAEPDNYHPPTGWNEAGTILRPPQQVWLYLSRPSIATDVSHVVLAANTGPTRDAFGAGSPFFQTDPQIWNMNWYPDGRLVALAYVETPETDGPYPMTLGAWTRYAPLDFSGHHVYYYVQGSFDVIPPINGSGIIDPLFTESITSPYQTEYDRLKIIYTEVKDAIESIRPGRTWVRIVDPWDYTRSNDLIHVPPQYFGTDHGTFSVGGPPATLFANQPIEYWPMLNPADTSPYFGTDFLYIYAGSPDTTEILINDAVNSSPAPTYDHTYVETARPHSLATLADSAAKFRRYSIRLFGLNREIPTFGPYEGAESTDPPAFNITLGPPDASFTCHVFATKAEADSDISFAAQAFWTPTGNDDVTGINDYIDGVNDDNAAGRTNNIAQLQQDAVTMSDLGVDAQYVAGSLEIVNAGYLVALIAGHYGFDPDTGIDI